MKIQSESSDGSSGGSHSRCEQLKGREIEFQNLLLDLQGNSSVLSRHHARFISKIVGVRETQELTNDYADSAEERLPRPNSPSVVVELVVLGMISVLCQPIPLVLIASAIREIIQSLETSLSRAHGSLSATENCLEKSLHILRLSTNNSKLLP